MRKTLATVAATAAAFALPLMATGTSYAANIRPVSPTLPNVGDTITISAIDAGALLAKLGGGCTTTYEGAVLSTGIGQLVGFGSSILDVTVYGSSAYNYTFAQVGNTQTYINCIY